MHRKAKADVNELSSITYTPAELPRRCDGHPDQAINSEGLAAKASNAWGNSVLDEARKSGMSAYGGNSASQCKDTRKFCMLRGSEGSCDSNNSICINLAALFCHFPTVPKRPQPSNRASLLLKTVSHYCPHL